MTMTKRFVWVFVFVTYQFFVSFIINCGEDTAYNLLTDESDASASQSATPCDCEGFITTSCEEECEAQIAADDDSTDEEEDTEDDSEEETEDDEGTN